MAELPALRLNFPERRGGGVGADLLLELAEARRGLIDGSFLVKTS